MFTRQQEPGLQRVDKRGPLKAETQIWYLKPLSSLEAEERNYRGPGNWGWGGGETT